MRNLVDTLAAELERPRELTAQVVLRLNGTYGADRDAIGPFLEAELPRLEDYEHDLILSSLFTPKLADQAIFAQLLGGGSVSRDQWPALIQQLAARPTSGQLVSSDRRVYKVPLREVTLERFVHRLRLEGTIPEGVLALIDLTPSAGHPLLKAVARRAVWEDDRRRGILVLYLTRAAGRNAFRLADAIELLDLMESYKPADVADLLGRIPHWRKVLEEEINTGSGRKPFFSDHILGSHGGDRDQRRQDEARQAAKERELEFLNRLQQLLAD